MQESFLEEQRWLQIVDDNNNGDVPEVCSNAISSSSFILEQTDFEAPPFENTPAIVWMHERTPRFGHGNDLMVLMNGTQEEQRDYQRGLMASSIAMVVGFVVWCIVLLVWKYLGPQHVGILSGTPRTRRNKQDGGTAASFSQKSILKSIVLLAGSTIIICSLLLSVNGVDSLSKSLNSGREGLSMVQDLARTGMGLMDIVIEQTVETGTQVDLFLQDINNICPSIRDPICTDLNDPTTCNFDGILDDESQQVLETVLYHFSDNAQGEDGENDNAGETEEGGESSTSNSRNIAYKDQLEKARTDLEGFLEVADQLDDQAAQFDWALKCAMAFSLLLSILCVFIILGLVLPTDRLPQLLVCLRSYLVVPTFCLLMTLSLVFSVVFILGSMTTADLCYDAPDSRIKTILNRFRDDFSPILVDFATYYIAQCPVELLPRELSDQVEYVVEGVPKITQLTNVVETNVNAIQFLCGTSNTDPTTLISAAQRANSQLCQIADLLNEIRMYFQCEKWFPLYDSTVYEAVCYNGTDGLAWVAITQAIIVFMAMIILTLRGVLFYNASDNNNESDGGNNNAKGGGDTSTNEAGSDRSSTFVPVSIHDSGNGMEVSV